MPRRPRTLDPQASPAALFGAELRALRLDHTLSLAALGQLVHVSGALVGKIEKAGRRPQADLIERLDQALHAGGLLNRLGAPLHDDAPDSDGALAEVRGPALLPEVALAALRGVIDAARAEDDVMGGRTEIDVLLTHARAVERVHDQVDRGLRPQVHAAIGEAYQLAGWISFDQGFSARAENLLGTSRVWAGRAADAALSAFVLGPSMSFVATYGGNPALGVERAYGAIGWARRSGNRRLTAFTMAIGARAHARLGETALCLDLLDHAHGELDLHTPDERDDGWLSVFDRAALDGHRGSCLLDLGLPGRALAPLAEQDTATPSRFVRNRVIWQLDRVEALLRLGEIEQACAELIATTAIPTATITPRVRGRFRSIELDLHVRDGAGVHDARERLRLLTAVCA